MVFDFKIDLNGLWIVPTKDRLTTASLHPNEIDLQISDLKAQLDTLAKKMKAKLNEPRQSPFT